MRKKNVNLFEGPPDQVQLVYQDLRRAAGRLFQSERRAHTLGPTELVHEAFIRLSKRRPKNYVSRKHFFGVVLRVMRQILVDYARKRNAGKHGGGLLRTSLDGVDVAEPEVPDFEALDKVLKRLKGVDPHLCQVAELRLFAGLSTREIALLLRRGESTIRRDWSLARAWIQRELGVASSVRATNA